jgi:hypothetical protein
MNRPCDTDWVSDRSGSTTAGQKALDRAAAERTTAHCHYRGIGLASGGETMSLNEIAKSHAYSALMGALDMDCCLLQIEYGGSGYAVDYRFIDTNPLFEMHTGLHDAVGRSALELIPDLERSAMGRGTAALPTCRSSGAFVGQ